jgi:radical SAM protein with 4Fe4S-binding SPASM domain
MIGIRELAGKVGRRLRRTAGGRTLSVQTDLANFCNLRCRMCYFHAGNPEVKIRVSYDEFCRRFDPFASRIYSFGLSCATEPLVLPEDDLFRVFDWVHNQGIPDSFMVTNAVLLRPRVAERFVDAGLSRLVVSLDSHVKENFEAIRVGARYSSVVDNVRHFSEYRRSRGLNTPTLQINCVLMRRNIEETGDFVGFIKEIGADAVDFRHVVVYEGLDMESESLLHYKQLCNKHLQIIRERCHECKLRIVSMPDDFSLTSQPPACDAPTKRACRIPKTFIYVRPTGEIQPCVFWFGEDPVGNLAEADFATVWNEPGYARFREEVASGILRRKCCLTCPSLGGGSVDSDSSFESKSL